MLPEDVSSVVGGELGAPGTTVNGVLGPGLESTAVVVLSQATRLYS